MLYKLMMVCVCVCVCALIFKAAFSLPLPFPDSSAPFLRQAAFLSPAWNGMQRKCEMGGGWWRLGCVLNHRNIKIFYLHNIMTLNFFPHVLFNLLFSPHLLFSLSHLLYFAFFILSSCFCSRFLFSPCFVSSRLISALHVLICLLVESLLCSSLLKSFSYLL